MSFFAVRPQVSLSMNYPSPILETDHRNVTLTCDVTSGNPPILDEVIWYLDGEILKHLPECNGTQNDGEKIMVFVWVNSKSDNVDKDSDDIMWKVVTARYICTTKLQY